MVPELLVEKISEQYGLLLDEILSGYCSKRRQTLRVNSLKIKRDNLLDVLDREGIGYEFVSWYDDALIVDDIDKLRCLDIYRDGYVYVQSLSSMIPPIILAPGNEKILDMAASPGGKTTEIFNLSNGQALITAVEKNPIRADRLKYNINKQGAFATVLVSDASKLDEFFRFDKILLDAPCSGSGTDKLEHFSQNLVNNCVDIQKKLLLKALEILKVNHTMVYSTCSILYEENEGQLIDLIKKGIIEIIDIEGFDDVPKLPTKIKGTLCVCPTDLYEGFFVAHIRRIK